MVAQRAGGLKRRNDKATGLVDENNGLDQLCRLAILG